MKPSMQNDATKIEEMLEMEREMQPGPQHTVLRLMDVDFTNSNGKNMQASVRDAWETTPTTTPTATPSPTPSPTVTATATAARALLSQMR